MWISAAVVLAAVAPAPRDLHARLLPSVAWVVAGDQGRGTGWLADAERRWLVTSYHVVGDAKTVDVVFPAWRDGRLIVDREQYQIHFPEWRQAGRVIRRDPARDLALIELSTLPANARAVPLASTPAAPGDAVHFVGNRRDIDQLWGHTAGHVRQTFRSADGYPWHTQRLARGGRLLAVQAAINDGDSGGPVVNGRGELVGVTAAILWQAQHSAAAIDVSEVRAFLGRPPAAAPSPGELYRRAVRGVAWVQAPSATNRATGRVFDRDRRLLLTTATAAGPHELVDVVFPMFEDGRVVAEAERYKDAPRVPAAVVARDLRRNLALLEAQALPESTAALPLADAPAQPGDALHGVGNPNGLEALWAYTALSVRQAGRVVLSDRKDAAAARVLVLQAPPGGSDSGGPVFDAAGRVAAVAGGKEGPEQHVSYAVDLPEIREFLRENESRWKPATAAELHRRGLRRVRVRWLDAARADLRAALELAPQYEPVYADLAELYRMRGESKEALAVVDHALALVSPADCAAPAAIRAAVLADLGKLDEALKACDDALKFNPKFARTFAERAEVWRRKKDLAAALKDADEAVWLDANLARAYLHRGRIHADRRDWDRAAADLGRAAELDPFDPQPLRLRAAVYDEAGEPQKAKADRAAAAKLEKR